MYFFSLDCISLKRRRNFEADKELRRRGLNPADCKSERKEACFVMTAEIPGCPNETITCKSKVFQCSKFYAVTLLPNYSLKRLYMYLHKCLSLMLQRYQKLAL